MFLSVTIKLKSIFSVLVCTLKYLNINAVTHIQFFVYVLAMGKEPEKFNSESFKCFHEYHYTSHSTPSYSFCYKAVIAGWPQILKNHEFDNLY